MKKLFLIGLIFNFLQLNSLFSQVTLRSKSLFNDRYYLIGELKEIPTYEQQQKLKESGVNLLEFIAGKSYVISVEKGIAPYLMQLEIFQNVEEIDLKLKMDKRLKDPPIYCVNGNLIDIVVLYFEDISREIIEMELKANRLNVLSFVPSLHHFVARIAINEIEKLASQPWIKYIAPIPPPFVPDNLVEKANHRTNVISADFPGARNLKGKGVKIGEWDSGPVGKHLDLKSRTFIRENKVNVSNHATHVAGTVMGSGVINPLATGMAPQAELYSWDFWDWIPYEMDTCIKYDTIVITQNSYVYDPNWDTCKNRGYYDIYSYLLDRLVRIHPNLIHVYAAGNSQSQCGEGGYRTVSSGPQSSKNAVDVGALSYTDQMTSFSSWGPVRDGRIKPEVCAVGSSVYSTLPNNNYGYYSGTSMACPGTSGTIALLYEQYRKIMKAEPDASTIKAILCNSATDYGNPGPDFKFGFGRINAMKAAKVIEEKRFIFDSLSNNQIRKDTVAVPSGTKQLRVMLCWSDVPASMYKPYDSISLVNNLDLWVTDPNLSAHYPLILDTSDYTKNAFESVDSINNIEQVVINNPVQGNYVINVRAKRVPNGYQTFTITYEFQKNEIIVTYPNGDESFNPATVETIYWDAFGNTSNFSIEYSTNNGQSWQNINTNVSSTQRYYNWTVPNTISSKCLVRISSGSISDVSDTHFHIMNKPLVLKTKSCNGFVYLNWPKVSQAKTYDVFMEVNGQMVKQANTSDTFYTIKRPDNINFYYFSINAYDSIGARSLRMNAVKDTPQFVFISLADTVCAGETKILKCQFSGVLPSGIQWQKSTDKGQTWYDIAGANDTFLVIPNIQKSQDGWLYRIKFVNKCFKTDYSENIEIRVDQGISFEINPPGLKKCVGDSAGLKIVANSLMPVNVKWQKSTDTINWTDITGAEDSIFIFDSLGLNDNGFYRLHAKNLCGVDTFSNYAEVIVYPPLSIDLLASSDTVCYGQSITLFGKTNGGDSTAYNYVWGNISGTNNQATDFIYQSKKFFVTVFDNCSLAAASDSVEVVVRDPIMVEITSTSDTICVGQQLVLKAKATGGRNMFYYSWNSGIYDDSIVVSPVRDSLFIVKVTDSCTSVIATDSFIVPVRAPLKLDILTATDSVCYGSKVICTALPSGGFSPNYQIIWNTDSSGPSMSFTADTTRWIKATLLDNCTLLPAADSLQIFVREPLRINAFINKDTVCAGNEITIQTQSSGGYHATWHYTWDNFPVHTPFLTEKIFFSKKYVVHLSDECSHPSASDSIEVFVRPFLHVKLTSSDDSVCVGQNVQFFAKATGGDTSSYSFNWNISADTFPQVNAKLNENKRVKVIVKDYCSESNSSDSLDIFVHQLNAGWKSTELSYRYLSFEPEDTLAGAYLWNFGDSFTSTDKRPFHLYKSNGTFRVCLTIRNYDNCDTTFCRDIYTENPYVNELNSSEKFIIFPNPNIGVFNLICPDDNVFYQYMLLNILGEKISEGMLIAGKTLKLETKGKGIFILVILGEREKYSFKIISE